MNSIYFTSAILKTLLLINYLLPYPANVSSLLYTIFYMIQSCNITQLTLNK